MKTCVVVYSNAGKAYAFAQTIAQERRADLMRIEPKFDVQGFLKYAYWGFKASFKRSVALKPDTVDFSVFDHLDRKSVV